MAKKLTTEEFIEKAIKIHGNKYNYNKVEYKKSYIKIMIICELPPNKFGGFLALS